MTLATRAVVALSVAALSVAALALASAAGPAAASPDDGPSTLTGIAGAPRPLHLPPG